MTSKPAAKPAPWQPWHPAKWETPDAAAIQALARGDASPEQQKRALAWITNSAAMTYDETFVAGQGDVSQFLAGRRNVGLQIVKLLKVALNALPKD